MYPNTIEVNRSEKNNFQFSFHKAFAIVSLVVSVIFLLFLGKVNATEFNPVQFDQHKENTVDDMDRLRNSLLRSLIKDQLIEQKTDRVNIIFHEYSMSVNEQILSDDQMHNYSSILLAFGVDPTPQTQIILKNELIFIGQHDMGQFTLQELHGRLEFEF